MEARRYKLSILPLFEEDLNEIVDYIALRLENPIAARALVDDVEKALIERTYCAESFEPTTRCVNATCRITAFTSATTSSSTSSKTT